MLIIIANQSTSQIDLFSMYHSNSTFVEIYKLTFKLESCFHQINRTLRQLMAKDIINRNDPSQEEPTSHIEDQQKDMHIKRLKKKKTRKQFSLSSQGGSAIMVNEDELSLKRQRIVRKSSEQSERQKSQTLKQKNRLLKPFHMFYKQQRQELLSKIPELSASAVSKIVLEMWRRLSQQEKQCYLRGEEIEDVSVQVIAENEVKEII